MTTREHAEQIKAMLVFNIDEAALDEAYDTAEILNELSMWISADVPILGYSHLVVYDIALRAGTPFILTLKHQRLILQTIDEYLDH